MEHWVRALLRTQEIDRGAWETTAASGRTCRGRARPDSLARSLAGMVGLSGAAETDLAPRGWVRVAGERWAARCETPVEAGTVISVQGLEIEVRREERS